MLLTKLENNLDFLGEKAYKNIDTNVSTEEEEKPKD